MSPPGGVSAAWAKIAVFAAQEKPRRQLTSRALVLRYLGITTMEDIMLELTDTARKELEAYFADKKKETIRIYSVSG